MSAPALRPCEPWDMEGCCDPEETTTGCAHVPASTDPDLVDLLQRAATEFLWAASGRRFGICTHVLRPCRDRCAAVSEAWRYPATANDGWSWWPVRCLCGSTTCSCVALSELALPRPVAEITEVLVDGVELDPTQYRVDNWRSLVRVDGESWPACQDLTLPSTEVGTWQVTYKRGRPVPALGSLAMSALVCQLVKLCNQDDTCALPRNMVSQSRQGITIRYTGDDATNAIVEFVPEVALFLRTYNPNKLQRRSRVYRADQLPIGRRTGT